MYANDYDDTHMGYNHVVAINNYYRVQQDRYQFFQDYRDQFIAYRKVCEQLGLKVGTSDKGGSNMLKRMNINNPTQQQKETENKGY